MDQVYGSRKKLGATVAFFEPESFFHDATYGSRSQDVIAEAFAKLVSVRNISFIPLAFVTAFYERFVGRNVFFKKVKDVRSFDLNDAIVPLLKICAKSGNGSGNVSANWGKIAVPDVFSFG